MSTAGIKLKLHKLIDSINDVKVLQEINALLLTKHLKQVDFWDELSDEQKEEIEESIAQADRGECIPHEEVMARIKERYKL